MPDDHNLTTKESDQSAEAARFVRKHKKELIEKFAGAGFAPDATPISLFMAGSPGAGKTEVSKRLIERFVTKPVRIDADEIRDWLPGYTGANAHIFTKASTLGVQLLYDHVLDKNLNVILDGTFAYKKYLENVERSLHHGRKVEIFYLYQDPVVAWDFTKKREVVEHRKVSKDIFITAFFAAREHADQAKAQFYDRVELNLVIKNVNQDIGEIKLNIDKVDGLLPAQYTEGDLQRLLI